MTDGDHPKPELRIQLTYISYEGKTVPQLHIEKRTLAGLEHIVVTRTPDKKWNGEWRCDCTSKSPQMLIMYDIDQAVKNIQRACTGSQEKQMRDMLGFCPSLLVYAKKCIAERGN